jgi:hypothetical protein
VKRLELLLLPLVAGFVLFVVAAARDVRRHGRAESDAAPTIAAVAAEDAEETPPEPAGPVADPALARKMLELGSAGTYIGAILDAQDSLVIRWPERTFEPLTVWIQPTSDIPDFGDADPNLARDGFEGWIDGSVPVRFTFVVDSARAAIHLTWVDRFEGDARIGNTRRTHRSDGLIVEAGIELAVHDSGGTVLPPHIVRAAALHEVGHLLGLDHSPDAGDIMHENASHTTRELSRADRRTLQLLYRLPPGPAR